MAKRKAKRIERDLTPAERKRIETVRAAVDKEHSEIVSRGRTYKRASEEARRLVAELKAARTRKKISLAGLKERTGLTRESVCALENAEHPNPTLATLVRYASAVGMQIVAKADTGH